MRKKSLLIIMIMMFFVLTGCGQQSYFLQVNEDNTVNFAAEIVVNSKTLEKLDSLNIQRDAIVKSKEPLFASIKKYYEGLGFRYTYSETDTEVKVSFVKIYPSISSFNEEIKTLYKDGKIGLGMGIKKDSGLSGTTTYYNGELKFLPDPDILNELKDNNHFYDYLKDISLTTYLTIYDKDKLVKQESFDTNENGVYKALVTGTWDLSVDQPLKQFSMQTENKSQIFAIITFIGAVAAVIILVVIVVGKGRIKFLSVLKNKISDLNIISLLRRK